MGDNGIVQVSEWLFSSIAFVFNIPMIKDDVVLSTSPDIGNLFFQEKMSFEHLKRGKETTRSQKEICPVIFRSP